MTSVTIIKIMASEEINKTKESVTSRGTISDYISAVLSHRGPVCPFVCIKCVGQKFLVPRTVLCQRSEIIKALAQSVGPADKWVIDMTNVEGTIMQKLLEFIQSHDVGVLENLPNSVMFGVMSVARALEMTEIEMLVFSLILKTHESYGTIAHLWDQIQKYHPDGKPVQELVAFVEVHMDDMIAKGFFHAISLEQLCTLLKDVNLDRDKLCNAVIQWLRAHPEVDEHVAAVARHLDWSNISEETISSLANNEPIFRKLLQYSVTENLWRPIFAVPSVVFPRDESPKGIAKSNSEELVKFLKSPRKPRIFHTTKSVTFGTLPLTPKKSIVNRPAILLFGAPRCNTLATQMYILNSRQWYEPYEIVKQMRSGMGCTYCKQNLYIFGGQRENGHVYGECFSWNIFNNVLRDLDFLPHPRTQSGIVLHDSEIFLLGGLNQHSEPVSVAFKLSLQDQTPTWKQLKMLKGRRFSPGVAVDSSGQIVVIGGHTCSCEYLCKDKQNWFETVSLPESYCEYGMHAFYYNGEVYAFREYNASEVCIFDIANGALRIKPVACRCPQKIACLCFFRDECWVLSPEGRFFIYNVKENCWLKTALKSNTFSPCFYFTIIDEEDARLQDHRGRKDGRRRKRVANHNLDTLPEYPE